MTKLNKEEMEIIINVLAVTSTPNLQTAQALINIVNKLSKMIDELQIKKNHEKTRKINV